MSVKIRLQRFGKRNQSFYHIVAADARAPRDGKFIEKLGIYNPRTNPATIELDNDKALKWLANGAQPSDTCRGILAYRGVMFRKHLNEGVRKNALTPEEADQRHAAWLEQKNLKITQKEQDIANKKKEGLKQRLADESKVRAEVAERVTAKRIAATEALAAEAKQVVLDNAAEASEASGEEPAEGTETAEAPVAEAPATPPADAPEGGDQPEAPEEEKTE